MAHVPELGRRILPLFLARACSRWNTANNEVGRTSPNYVADPTSLSGENLHSLQGPGVHWNTANNEVWRKFPNYVGMLGGSAEMANIASVVSSWGTADGEQILHPCQALFQGPGFQLGHCQRWADLASMPRVFQGLTFGIPRFLSAHWIHLSWHREGSDLRVGAWG